ncbi:MAG: ABC transporter permease [Alistipes sp.]|nr:ABC transporter permease [Alistipes sp.]
MSSMFCSKLAVSNIRKNSKTYIPYILTCVMTVMMFYIMKSLSLNPGIKGMTGDWVLSYLLGMGSYIVGAFSLVFLFYTNSFLMRRRKKEFGVFNILGLEKKHLAKVMAFETLFVALIGLGAGIGFGIALDKIMFLLIAKMIGVKASLGFYVSWEVIRYTIVLFGIIFALIYLWTVLIIKVSNPIELLRGGNVGEKEPKTKWIMAILGAASLGAGYYIALTMENPIAAIELFFPAVILVIIGTYFLFTAGSIAFLKMLKKNKRYYYQTKHFISVSGMIYRMKQNAVGLANICILSTAVLVMVSSTTSLVAGTEDILTTRYPNSFGVYSEEPSEEANRRIISTVKEVCREENLSVKGEVAYHYLNISVINQGNVFRTAVDDSDVLDLLTNVNILMFSTVDDYNAIMGERISFADDEVMIFSNREAYPYDTITVFGREYKIVNVLDDFYGNGRTESNIASTHYIIVSGMEELKRLEQFTIEASQNTSVTNVIRYYYGVDSDDDEQKQVNVFTLAKKRLGEFNGYSEIREANRPDLMSLYGGFFFLGVFLGVLFLMATVLIIYYKQISEGYEDRERFEIMQKVGMSRSEVKSAIRSQVLTVFFLPLIVAGVHTAVAFPILTRLLAMLNMNDVSRFAGCVAASFGVFAVLYMIIYAMTAKAYYKIVRVR